MEKTFDFYTIHIQGTDMDTRFYLQDQQDLEVLELILAKIRKKMLLARPVTDLNAKDGE